MKWRRYPEYKDSGIEWLREIPAHWKAKPTKAILARNDGGVWGEDFDDEGIIVLRSTEQTVDGKWNIVNPAKRKLNASEYAACLLMEGDLVVTKSSGSSLHIGKTTIVTKEVESFNCCYSNFMQRLRVKQNTIPRFIWYVLNGDVGRKQFDYFSSTTTGLSNLNAEIIGNVCLALPTIAEQCAIATFLDRETEKIDRIVALKERQIELLQEKRTALISHAVTKGLDPNIKMKDSGIEWLGEIPEHWEVKKIKYVSRIMRGKFSHRPRNDPEFYDGPYPFIQTGDVAEADKYITTYQQTLNKKGFSVSKYFPKGTLVMSIAANIGDVAILHFPACFPDSIVGFVPERKVFLDFLYYNLKAMKQPMIEASTINTQFNLNLERIGALFTVCPPLSEQQDIADYLDKQMDKINTLIAKVREGIEKITEYRITLISAAVTGKIDVREEVAVLQPKRKANVPFQRAVLAAEIVSRLHKEPTFGRVKFQKILYLCEHHLGMNLAGNYRRKAAGPFDNALMRSVQSQIEKQKWFHMAKDATRSTFIPMENTGGHIQYFDNYWCDHREELDGLIELLKPLNTKRCEIVATLFAAWNDMLIKGKTVTDDAIIRDVRTNWHESKESYSADQLKKALQWMRENGLVPRGIGKATKLPH